MPPSCRTFDPSLDVLSCSRFTRAEGKLRVFQALGTVLSTLGVRTGRILTVVSGMTQKGKPRHRTGQQIA